MKLSMISKNAKEDLEKPANNFQSKLMPRKYFTSLFFSFIFLSTYAQISLNNDVVIDYTNPQEYEIGGITVSGIQFLDNNALILLSGLSVGDKVMVPGEKITKAVRNYWKQGLFSDVSIVATKIQGSVIFLEIVLKERPRLSKFTFKGIKKGEADKIREKIKLTRGDVVTDNLIMFTTNKIKEFYAEKGFLNCDVNIIRKPDSSSTNSEMLIIQIDKKEKVKISNINIIGNHVFSDKKIRRLMKKTKEKNFFRIFKTSRYDENEYKADKEKIIAKYNNSGYRDAIIVRDSVYKTGESTIGIDIVIEEGRKYYFRNITWLGNTKYTNEQLNEVLRIKKGDVYNQELLETNLRMSKDGRDVTSLYMDDGYLFFNVNPVEVNIEHDSIDLEIRMYEGKQAKINKVTVTGNYKTNDRVIMREIRTKPGQLFSRSDIIRSQRELAQLRFFNAEKLNVNPKPNPAEGTVDIEYVVEETSSDQLELSGGWGAGRVTLSLGLTFNNFSSRNLLNGSAWRPLPMGDGQQLSMRIMTYGLYSQLYSISFTEPWLGGKKPNSLNVSLYHSALTNGLDKANESFYGIYIWAASVGLGKRLQWPDDYFTLYQNLTYKNYILKNYAFTLGFNNGSANSIAYTLVFARNSIDAPIFPRSGSEISLTAKATPPLSLIDGRDYTKLTPDQKFKWVEYHKWKLSATHYTKLAGNLVLRSRFQMGFLGYYNKDIGFSPFERYYMGGDGLYGYGTDEREIIALRGYSNNSLSPSGGGSVYDRFTAELRYPVSLNPMATIYVLGFAEGGNVWPKFKYANPYQMYKSAGLGVRIFLPMFGMLGLDYGYGFDPAPGENKPHGGEFHFSIGQSID